MPPAELPDYYEILEVSRRASPETIKAAWRALCKKYHPDTHGGNAAQAEEAVKKLNEAYRVLGDAQRRAAYDSALNRPTAPRRLPGPRLSKGRINGQGVKSASFCWLSAPPCSCSWRLCFSCC